MAMNYVAKYTPKDLDLITPWLEARGSYLPHSEEMPQIGCIAYIKGQAVAAAFLRRVEGGYAQLDGLVSNPAASPEARNEAIDIVVTKIMINAALLCIKAVIAHTRDENTLLRSQRHGFVEVPQTLIVADLSSLHTGVASQ